MRLVFDIETDGLLKDSTRMWIMTAYDLDTAKSYEYLEGDLGWMGLLNDADEVIGHFLIGFDLPVLKKLFDYDLPPHVKVKDTLILSQITDYKRFGNDGHSLGRWGQYLGIPKPEHANWDKFSQAMRIRNQSDVAITVEVYRTVMKEYSDIFNRNPKIKTYIAAEHAAAAWCAEAERHGWPFDVAAAKQLYADLEAQMKKAYDALSSKLGMKCVVEDRVKGVVDVKKPKWTKDGFYNANTASWFNVDPCSGFEDRPIMGDFCRVSFKELSLDSVADVKMFLFRNGWQPTEYNFKLDASGKKIKGAPKITEDSLEFLGGDGKLYTEFLTSRSRYGILKTWLERVDLDGMLHGDCMVIGTPSMRARHNIIVNVPSADSKWGPEMRRLFICKPGWRLIGCDSAGNQARGLAHFLGDPVFIDTLLNGDIHNYNADKLTEVLLGMMTQFPKLASLYNDYMQVNYSDEERSGFDQPIKVKRGHAKRILYAFLFGASGAKLWSYLFGTLDDKYGKVLRAGFLEAVPGFADLINKLSNIYWKTSQNGNGYIPSIAGNRLYVDSSHKLLVYLLQATEKLTCSAALMLTVKRLKAAGIPYIPCIFYHDEIDFQVPAEFAEAAAAIGKQAFVDGPKLFGIDIMDGDAKVGLNWMDVH